MDSNMQKDIQATNKKWSIPKIEIEVVMLNHMFKASRRRDLLLQKFFNVLREEDTPKRIVGAFAPLLSEMASFPDDDYLSDAFSSGFQLIHARLPKNEFVMVALHVMGLTNQRDCNAAVARAIVFAHIQEHFKGSLSFAAASQPSNQVAGLVFAARSVVLSSLEAGHITEARHIVSDLQEAIHALRRDEQVAPHAFAEAAVSVIKQTLNELAPRVETVKTDPSERGFISELSR